MLSFLALGFLVGLRHALEPDHLAAVASLTTRGGTLGQRARTGALWGLGHALTLLLLAGTCVLLEWTIPDTAERLLEAAVGAMLVGLGVSVFVRMRRSGLHFHAHQHEDGDAHFHAHAHEHAGPHDAASAHEHAHTDLRSLWVGGLHGLAGSAALVILVGGAARAPWLGLLYVALFGLGATTGMLVLAATISLPLGRSAERRTLYYRAFCGTAGVFSIAVGAQVLWSMLLGRA